MYSSANSSFKSGFRRAIVRARPDAEDVIVSLRQRVESILGLLNSASMSLRIMFARFRCFAARTVCPPCGKNGRIIRLREHEARLSTACLDGPLEYDPRRTDIPPIVACVGAPNPPSR